ncbi:MAG TPA: hypothetical protein VKA40_10380 [Nitrososphaera sp.]|nr:hypothetical protein [Nitrososphaera sp.]
MAQDIACRQIKFGFEPYKETSDYGEYKYIRYRRWVKATEEEHIKISNFWREVVPLVRKMLGGDWEGQGQGQELTEEESNRLDQLHQEYLKVIRKSGCFTHDACRGRLRRMYARSNLEQEPEPIKTKSKKLSHEEQVALKREGKRKRIQDYWGYDWNKDKLIIEKRKRQFVPFGWYCDDCKTFMTNEQRTRLFVEMRAMHFGWGNPSAMLYPEFDMKDNYPEYQIGPTLAKALQKLQPSGFEDEQRVEKELALQVKQNKKKKNKKKS